MKYVLVWSDYDGSNVERFISQVTLEARVTEIMDRKAQKEYGEGILFAGLVNTEYKMTPKQVRTLYVAEPGETYP